MGSQGPTSTEKCWFGLKDKFASRLKPAAWHSMHNISGQDWWWPRNYLIPLQPLLASSASYILWTGMECQVQDPKLASDTHTAAPSFGHCHTPQAQGCCRRLSFGAGSSVGEFRPLVPASKEIEFILSDEQHPWGGDLMCPPSTIFIGWLYHLLTKEPSPAVCRVVHEIRNERARTKCALFPCGHWRGGFLTATSYFYCLFWGLIFTFPI